jgi:hypothetical protein
MLTSAIVAFIVPVSLLFSRLHVPNTSGISGGAVTKVALVHAIKFVRGCVARRSGCTVLCGVLLGRFESLNHDPDEPCHQKYASAEEAEEIPN